MMRKASIALAVLIALGAGALWLGSGPDLPPVPDDGDLVARFRDHRDAFEALRTLLADEPGPVLIAPAHERPAERFQPAVALLRAIGAESVARGGDRSISVTMYDAGQLTSGVTIDIVWRLTPPAPADPVAHTFVPLDGNWYLERYVH